MSLVVDVPANEWISSNSRLHWANKARRTKALRQRAFFLARKAHLRVETPVLVVAEIGYPRGGRADQSNAAPTVKACLDGLTDAGVWPDDDSEHVVGPHFTRGPTTATKGLHRITFTFHRQHVNF